MELSILSELIKTCTSLREIAEKTGYSQSNVKHWLRKYGIYEEYLRNKNVIDTRVILEKTCPACLETKKAEDFYRRPDKRLNSYCKECTNLKSLESGKLSPSKPKGPSLSREEINKKISDGRKRYLAANPDKHPWRKKGDEKFKSVPCEKMKEFLLSKGLTFVAEYQPEVGGRHFSIDIAFPDKKIAIEVNGTQHYERDGSLKPYYQERHNILESNGWQVYEVYYSMCYNLEKWETMIPVILGAEKKVEFDYLTYVPKAKTIIKCPNCGGDKFKTSKVCMDCRTKEYQKPYVNDRVSKEELEKLVNEMPMTKIGEKFGVTDNAVKKWCQNYGINVGNRRGYWTKKIKK